MLAIPRLGKVPRRMLGGGVSPPLARMAQSLADGGFMVDADLRVSTGGVRRLVEKPLQRWWDERKIPAPRILPLKFAVAAGSDFGPHAPEQASQHAWLFVENSRRSARVYLHNLMHRFEGAPEIAGHVAATMYLGLNASCYALKPDDMLRLARAYWWEGADDEKAVRARGGQVMSRRQFNNRVHPLLQAPHFDRRAMRRAPPRLQRMVREVESWARDPRVLRPNAQSLTGRPAGALAVALRAKYGDPAPRLEHDHFANVYDEDGNPRVARFHSAWRVPQHRAGIQRLLDRVEATARLIGSLEELMDSTCTWARGNMW